MFGLFSSFIGLLLVLYLIAHRRLDGHLLIFSFSKFLQGFSAFGLAIATFYQNSIVINSVNISLVVGYAIEVYIVVLFDQYSNKSLRFNKIFLLFLAVALLFNILLIVLIPDFSTDDLLKFLHLTSSLCFGIGAYQLFRKRHTTRFVIMVAISYTLFSIAWLNSSAQAFLGVEGLRYLDGNSTREYLIYLSAALNMIVASVGYLLMLKDLDELQIHRKNLRIESDNRQLANLNAKKDKFFSIIAHDLKGPIGGLLNLGEVLHKKHEDMTPVKREEIIKLLIGSTKETVNLLDNLLQWSRSESRQMEVRPEEISIDKLVRKNLALLKQDIEQKKIVITNKIDEDVCAWCDQNMLDFVVRNLISNAIKYVNPNGHIEIAAWIDSRRHLFIMSITDDGVGIETKAMKKLFNIESSYTTKGTNNEPGTGLGLKTCKEFISSNDGLIQVQSKAGKGSTFTITLPTR